jgi:hypothetical protein
MKKKSLVASLLLVLFAQIVWAQREIPIGYFKPFQFHNVSGQLVVKAWLGL